jgi:hypothetical protein
MSEIEELEQLLDDFEVEITNLDRQSIIGEHKGIPLLPWPKKMRSTRYQPKKILLFATAACTVLLTFLVIPSGFSIVQSTIQQAAQNLIITPTPAIPPGYDSFYIDKDIPWVKVFVDGHQIDLPRMGIDKPLKIGRGHHLISWHADPFQQQSCLLSIPFTIDNSCHFAFNLVVYKSSMYQIILLRESLNTVSLDQRTALVSAIQAELEKLSTSETVQPGEQYAGESGPVTARQPLRATLKFQLDTNSNWVCFANMQTSDGLLCGIDKQDCRQLCSAPWQFKQQEAASSFASGWLTLVMTRSSWNYSTEDGRIVASDQPLSLRGSEQSRQLLLLRITWNDAWYVKVLPGPDLGPPMYTNTKSRAAFGRNERLIPDTVQVADDPACNVARPFVIGGLATGSQVRESIHTIVRLVSSSDPAIGCLVITTATNTTNTTPAPVFQTAYYLVRFGILLTANPVAYFLRPKLPRADAYELSLVQQLATLPGQTFADAVSGF